LISLYQLFVSKVDNEGISYLIDGDCVQRLSIHPNSVLFKTPPEWVVFHEVIVTTKEFMREVTAIKAVWLSEIAPHFYELKKLPLPSHEQTTSQTTSSLNIQSTTSTFNSSRGIVLRDEQ
jgi:HrpA-like RNA helicase